jgi:hypothetical protein
LHVLGLGLGGCRRQGDGRKQGCRQRGKEGLFLHSRVSLEVVVGTAPGLPSNQEITLGYLPLPMKLIAFSITEPYGLLTDMDHEPGRRIRGNWEMADRINQSRSPA